VERVTEALVDAAVDWHHQRVDFEPDGSLRDIYVQAVAVEDWQRVVAMIVAGGYRARLLCGSAEVPMPSAFEAVFDRKLDGVEVYSMSFSVGGVALDCHFFDSTEIEFSFWPDEVTEGSLRDLLAFLIDVGDAAGKPAILTHENGPQAPIFRYDPGASSQGGRLRWRG